jgi:hypothetical protein
MHGIVCCCVRLSFCHCVIAVITIFETSHSYNLRQKMAAINGSISADFTVLSVGIIVSFSVMLSFQDNANS